MPTQERKPGLGTLALHAGQQPDPATTARAVPIYATSSYVFKETDSAANLFALKEFGNIYSRLMNPTNDVLEKRLAALDGGIGGLAFASGQAAITAAILTITHAGQNFIAATSLYGGTWTLFTQTLKKLGVEVRFFNSDHPEEIDAGSEFVLAVHHLVEGDELSGVGGHTPHGSHQAGLGTALDFVVGLVLTDGLDQVLPLEVIGRVLRLRVSPEQILIRRRGLAGPSGDLLPLVDPRTARRVRRSGDDGRALGTVRVAGELVVASGHIAAVVKQLDAIGVGVL